jgi:hypothetical protein
MVGRRYRTPDGTEKTAASFGVHDLPKLIMVLTQAYSTLVNAPAEPAAPAPPAEAP